MITEITWNVGFGFPLPPERIAQMAALGIPLSTSATFDLDLPEGPPEVALEALFAQTNQYEGPLWDAITAQGLPDGRDHTALSVGDVVTFNGRAWECASIGWEELV